MWNCVYVSIVHICSHTYKWVNIIKIYVLRFVTYNVVCPEMIHTCMPCTVEFPTRPVMSFTMCRTFWIIDFQNDHIVMFYIIAYYDYVCIHYTYTTHSLGYNIAQDIFLCKSRLRILWDNVMFENEMHPSWVILLVILRKYEIESVISTLPATILTIPNLF